MSEITLLEQNDELIAKKIQEEFGKTKKDQEDCLEILKKWMNTQKHLPERDNETLLRKLLLVNKFSVERTKQTVDMYYTMRSTLPDMFGNPNAPNILLHRNVCVSVPLPKLTAEGNRVFVSMISNKYSPDDFVFKEFFPSFFGMLEVVIKEDNFIRVEGIIDGRNHRIGHVPKFDLMTMKKAQVIFEKVFSNRLAALHLVNLSSYMDTVVALGKTVASPKIAKRIIVHKSPEKLYELYPKELLPEEFGGTEVSIDKLNEQWTKKLLQYDKRFEELRNMKVDETLRQEPLTNDDILGWHGNFRKLDVD